MKRWLSFSFALGSILGVLLVSIFAFFRLQLDSLNAAASPVNAQSLSTQKARVDSESYTEAAQFFKAKGITLSTNPTVPLAWASWEPYVDTSNANVRVAAADLKQEWTKYSDQILKGSGIKAIYLVRNLVVNGQARSGMPDPEVTHALYFDISDVYLESENGNYMRRTYHHEFSHLIEYHKYGAYAPADVAWNSCNAKTAVYGDGGSAMYANPEFAHTMHPSYGFIDGYATSAPEEDKAEVFAYYMTEKTVTQTLAAQDAGIACKVAHTESLLRNL